MATINITLTVPTAQQVSDITDDFCTAKGYNSLTDGTKANFVKTKIGQWVKGIVVDYRVERDKAIAIAASGATADANTQIT